MMMRRALFLLLFFTVSTAFANSAAPDTNKAQLSQVNTQIKTLTTTLTHDQTQVSSLQKNLKTTDLAVAAINGKLNQINQQLSQQQKLLKQLQAQQAHYNVELSSQQATLSKQMRSAYLLSNENPIKLLLNQQDPNQFSRMLHYYQYVNAARLQMISDINHTIIAIAANASQIQLQADNLQQLKSAQQQKRNELSSAKQQQQQVITTLSGTIKTNQDKLQQLLANKRALENVITQLQQTVRSSSTAFNLPKVPFAKLQGRLPWPTRGKVIQSYGSNIDSNDQLKLSAVIIAAPEGQPVYAIAPGKVVFADWLRGLGMLMIVDQGNGYMALYGYNQSLYKKTGDTVRAGDLIATVGKSGGQQQSSLYFGIRHDTTALNPMVWLNSNRKLA